MKIKSLHVVAILSAVLAAMGGCKKWENQLPQNQNDEACIELLVSKTDNFTTDAIFNDPNSPLALENQGISPDFTVVPQDFDDTEGPAELTGSSERKSFIHCLRRLVLSTDQKGKIRRILDNYEQCKEFAVKRARAIYNELLAEYHQRAERIEKALNSGLITKEEYTKMIAQLREDFRHHLRKLQLQEKLDLALKNCYREVLGNLKGVLTEGQWNRFLDCHR